MQPKTFSGLVRGRAKSVREVALAMRDLVFQAADDVQESFYGGQRPMAQYRTAGELCWIQPLKDSCNLYFLRGPELSDEMGIFQGTSSRYRYIKVRTLEALAELPVLSWLEESLELNAEAVSSGPTFDEIRERIQELCSSWPSVKETLTWGKPHFRVKEKIFCGCGEEQGSPRIGLKMEPRQSEMMMRVPGIVKAPYSRKGDGWVQIDPGEFDDWPEIASFIEGSYRLIAPKRLVAQLDLDD